MTGTPTARRDSEEAARRLAIVRVAAIPVIFTGERLVEHPTFGTNVFLAILLGAAAYSLVAMWLAFRGGPPALSGSTYTFFDLFFISALTFTSGGAASQLRYAFFVLPVAAALLLGPRLTAAVAGLSLSTYIVIAALHPTTARSPDFEFVLTQVVYLSWMSLTAILLSQLLTLRSMRIAQLASDRGRLVAQALDAEDRERRRLSEALHDEAIQNLLAASQDLAEASAGDGSGLARAQEGVEQTISQLREAVFDLHPYALERVGLQAALREVAAQQGRRAGYRWTVGVAPEAEGVHDQLVFTLGREFLINAARHAYATEVSLTLARDGEHIVLEVADNGCGIESGRREEAALEGHTGLASSAGRVEVLGGTFELSSAPDQGTVVRASLPASGRAAPELTAGAASR